MLLERTSQACYKYMAIFGELVPSWLYSQLQVIDPITSVVLHDIGVDIRKIGVEGQLNSQHR